jgi:hypothetical protein
MQTITIHFVDGPSAVPLNVIARAAGSEREAWASIGRMVDAGALRPNADGSFTATVPEDFQP